MKPPLAIWIIIVSLIFPMASAQCILPESGQKISYTIMKGVSEECEGLLAALGIAFSADQTKERVVVKKAGKSALWGIIGVLGLIAAVVLMRRRR